jgi:hypothetical protein
MNRYLITGLAVAVLAGVIALVISLRSDESEAEPNGKAPVKAKAKSDPRPSGDPEIRVAERGEKPSVDIGDSDVVVSDDKIYYRDDGTMVRDHRGGDRPQMDKGVTERPRGMRKVDAETIVSVRHAIRPHVNGCATSLGDDAFGDDPAVQGVVKLSIKDNQLSVDEMDMQLRGIDEGSGAELIDCIRGGISDLTLDATGHPDVDSYTLTLPYDLKR